ncbi:nuclease [Kappamyces sp. JEL0680]|nr:nuclease [Kappamyces sp. JEL0680]
MSRVKTLASLLGGIGIGAVGMALYLQRAPSDAVDVDKQGVTSPLEQYGLPQSKGEVLRKSAYLLDYNRASRNAYWVGEVLQASATEDHEKVERSKSHFKEDTAIDGRWRSRLGDYAHSGYDRGHLVPAADAESQHDMNETFLVSNMSPQVAVGFNRGYWAQLERFCRSLKKEFDQVQIYTGPLFLPKKDAAGKSYITIEVLGDPPNTHVPTHFYKVILAQKGGLRYVAAFVLPNAAISATTPLSEFLVPLDAVERSSGIEFFPALQPHKAQLPNLCSRVDCRAILPMFKPKAREPPGPAK